MLFSLREKWISLTSDVLFSKIFTGSVWAFFARIFTTVLGFSFSILVARFYGAGLLGIIAVIQSFLTLVLIFSVFGTTTSLLRLIPEHIAKYSVFSAYKVYLKTQYMVITVSLFLSVVIFFYSDLIAIHIFKKEYLSYYIGVTSGFICFYSVFQLNIQVVRGLSLIKVYALMMFLPQLLQIVFVLCLCPLLSTKNLPFYAVLGGFSITGLVACIIVNHNFKLRIHPEENKIVNVPKRFILSLSVPMLMSDAMLFLTAETGILILSIFRSDIQIGYYSMAVKLSMISGFILNAVNVMTGPKFAELFHLNRMDDLFYIAKKSAKLIFWGTFPIFLGLIVFGKFILGIAFGNDFIAAYHALLFLVAGQFVNAITGATGMFMNMSGNEHMYLNILIVSAIINIVLNFLLAPDWGINGTAVATMVTMCFWHITTVCYIKYKFGKSIAYFPFLNF